MAFFCRLAAKTHRLD